MTTRSCSNPTRSTDRTRGQSAATLPQNPPMPATLLSCSNVTQNVSCHGPAARDGAGNQPSSVVVTLGGFTLPLSRRPHSLLPPLVASTKHPSKRERRIVPSLTEAGPGWPEPAVQDPEPLGPHALHDAVDRPPVHGSVCTRDARWQPQRVSSRKHLTVRMRQGKTMLMRR